jgi:hypothetical protein
VSLTELVAQEHAAPYMSFHAEWNPHDDVDRLERDPASDSDDQCHQVDVLATTGRHADTSRVAEPAPDMITV